MSFVFKIVIFFSVLFFPVILRMDAVNRIISSFGDLTHFNPIEEEEGIRFSSQDIETICRISTENFRNLPNILQITSPVTIVGDIHGNINDLLRIFAYFSPPPTTHYLFLGDYVDRGMHSLSVITLLLAMMIKYPGQVSIIRGNHEFGLINRYYGFFDEIITKYEDDSLWNLFQETFNYMPLCAIIDNKVFCVHGGISPLLKTVQDIALVKKPLESYLENEMICDVLWSDPDDSKEAFTENRRGLGCKYSADAVHNFLEANRLSLLIRAHQCVINGISLFADKTGMTVFSSSNYDSRAKNKSGVIVIPNTTYLVFYSLDPTVPFEEQVNIKMYFSPNKPGLQQSLRRFSYTETKKPIQQRRAHSDVTEVEKEKEVTQKPKPERRRKSKITFSEMEQARHDLGISGPLKKDAIKPVPKQGKSQQQSHQSKTSQQKETEIEKTEQNPTKKKQNTQTNKAQRRRSDISTELYEEKMDAIVGIDKRKGKPKGKKPKSSLKLSTGPKEEEEIESLFEQALKKC